MEKYNNVIIELNNLLGSSQVFYANVHSHHWNIRGESFFETHEQLGELYDNVGNDIDIFAERILALGGTPDNKLSVYLEKSDIDEVDVMHNFKDIANNVLEGLVATRKQYCKISKIADEVEDKGTINLIDDKITCIEKSIWFWSANLDKTVDFCEGTKPTNIVKKVIPKT